MPPLSSPPPAPDVPSHLSLPPFEVADIVRAYGAGFRATQAVSHEQARVLRAIAHCRTAALGGHVEQCVTCGTERVCYDSCRNRHCPKCQGSARAKWLAAEQAMLLPIPYFHVVFTLPPRLTPLIRVNPRALYDLLFQTAAQTAPALRASASAVSATPTQTAESLIEAFLVRTLSVRSGS